MYDIIYQLFTVKINQTLFLMTNIINLQMKVKVNSTYRQSFADCKDSEKHIKGSSDLWVTTLLMFSRYLACFLG